MRTAGLVLSSAERSALLLVQGGFVWPLQLDLLHPRNNPTDNHKAGGSDTEADEIRVELSPLQARQINP